MTPDERDERRKRIAGVIGLVISIPWFVFWAFVIYAFAR